MAKVKKSEVLQAYSEYLDAVARQVRGSETLEEFEDRMEKTYRKDTLELHYLAAYDPYDFDPEGKERL